MIWNTMPVLHEDAENADYSMICRHLQSMSGKINQKAGKEGWTPLHIIASNCAAISAAIVRELLARGASADLQDKKDRTPLHLACTAGNIQVVMVLLGKNRATAQILDQAPIAAQQGPSPPGYTPPQAPSAAPCWIHELPTPPSSMPMAPGAHQAPPLPPLQHGGDSDPALKLKGAESTPGPIVVPNVLLYEPILVAAHLAVGGTEFSS
eukprot:gene12096-15206_t